MTRSPRLLAFSFLLFSARAVQAAPAASFTQTSTEDFEEGEASGTMITPPGQVERGLESQRVPVDAAFVWTSVLAEDGGTLFVGTGDPGRLHAISIASGQARLVAELPEPWITAMAVESARSLLVATTPGAKLYRVNVADGKWKQIARLDSEHIWALVHDRQAGLTYAATGSPGRIAVIDSAAKVRRLWDANDQHLVSLARGPGGTLIAGSADKAILFRVSAQGQAFALNDFEATEVRAVLQVGEAIYAAVNAFEPEGEAASQSKDKGAKGTPIAGGGKTTPVAAGRLPRAGASKAKGAIYRLDPSGAVEPLLTLDSGYFTSLAADPQGHVHAATGSDGKVYRIDPDRNVALVLDLPERQALTVASAGAGLVAGTGDAGAVFLAKPASDKTSIYLSRIFDAARPARWGQFRYGASANLPIETRSGNTARPDATWSDWSALTGTSFARAQGQGGVASPSARYLQYRVLMPAKARLRDVTIFHRTQNLRPRVTDLSLAPGEGGEKREHAGTLKLRWKVDNADGDTLTYRLAYKPEADAPWRVLVPQDEALSKPEYDWNTETIPDGEYVVRVHVTDAASVPQDQALDSTYVSTPLLVDNTRPSISELAARLPAVVGVASDAASVVSHVEFSVNGGAWQSATPEDGLFDQTQERFTLRVPSLPKGDHVVAVRAYDAANNVVVRQIVVNQK